MRIRIHRCLPTLALAVVLAGCQNADLLRPQEVELPDQDTRSTEFRDTEGRLDAESGGGAAGRLTADVAQARMRAILASSGAERLRLVEALFLEYPETAGSAELHRLAGEARLALGDHVAAAAALQRVISLLPTDVIGLPMNAALPYQLGLANWLSGNHVAGAEWLVHASVVDSSPQLQEALRWAYVEQAEPTSPTAGVEGGESWRRQQLDKFLVAAPEFELPGLQVETVALVPGEGVTLLNFWSPT